MKTRHLFLTLIASLALSASVASGQQLTTLHSFNSSDGYVPLTGLTQGADGNFYGVTQAGGAYGYGVAFRISSAGSYTLLHSFGQNAGDPQKPFGKLTPGNDGNFYGTTTHGGSNDYGTIYKMAPDGTVTLLHSMAFADGVAPTAGLLLGSDGNFYGAAPNGGTGSGPVGAGTIFKVTPNGTLTVLHSFTAAFANTNSDGQSPFGALVEGADGSVYGTTYGGGQFGFGILFGITKNGIFTSLYSFGAQSGDGSFSRTGLCRANDGAFYGTCSQGGFSNKGTIFKMTTSGTAASTNVQTLHSFTGVSGDGALPLSPLIQGNDGKLYGMTASGGGNGSGLIYQVAFDGTFTPLYSFGTQPNDGTAPNDSLLQASDGTLYGTTSGGGGTANAGTIFKFGSAVVTPAKIDVVYEGKVRDRVSKADAGVSSDGELDATFTVTLRAGSGARQVTSIELNRGDGNDWDTTPGNAQWLVGAAVTLDGPLLNESNGSVNFSVGDGSSFKIFASDNGNLFSAGNTFTVTLSFVDKTTAVAAVVIPATKGVAPVSFMVNGSSSPAYPPVGTTVRGLADTVLQFMAQEIGDAAGMSVRVQATTTPSVESSWTNLPNSSAGAMLFESASNRYLLSSNEYPYQQADPVYFRALATAPGYSNSVSNVVGPFDLTSNKPRLSTTFYFTGNGPIADLYFKAIESATPSGIAVRVQSTTSPGSEQSWTDLPNGGGMHQTNDPAQFVLFMDKLSNAGPHICFRAIASAPGYVDSISNLVGPFNITSAIPPAVTLTGPAGSGTGTSAADPLIVTSGSLHFHVTAQTSRSLSQLSLVVDGKKLVDVKDGTTFIDYVTSAISVGLHVVEARAIDDLRVTGRAPGVIYLQVNPAPAAARAERTGANGATADSTGTTYTAIQDFFWNQGSTWRNETTGKTGNGYPGPNDLAIIGDHHIAINTSSDYVIVRSVSIASGGIRASDADGLGNRARVVVSGVMTITGGASFDGPLDIAIGTGALFETTSADDISFSASGYDPVTGRGIVRILNAGSIDLHGSGNLHYVDEIDNAGILIYERPVSVPTDALTNPSAGLHILDAAVVTGSGSVDAIDQNVLFNNGFTDLIAGDGAGTIAQGGGNLIGHDSGSLIGHDSGSLIGHDGGSLIGHDSGSVVGPGGASIISDNGAGITGGGNAMRTGGGKGSASVNKATARGYLEAESGSAGFTQTGGVTNLNGLTIIGPVTLNGGVLSGSGIIHGDVTNNGGYITPGGSSAAGTLAVTGNFAQTANGSLIVERAGADPSEFDQLQVGGTASVDGKLDVKNINGYAPDVSDTFNPLGYQSVSGSFSSISSNARLAFNSTGVIASVDPGAPQPKAGQPLNISTRMAVLGGDNTLIGGFIVTGPAGSSKKVLIRGLGPSLANFGVASALADPFLELHEPDGTVISNDNWQQGDTTQIPNGFAPTDSRESVIVATLSPGNYTAILKGAHGETGVGIAEVYDLDSSSAAQLANISTRGFINTGDDVMIGGFIVGGSEPAKILVRAIGPTLSDFGVQGALEDPTLELHDSNGAAITNDDWRETQESEIIATTIPPHKDREPAILATLAPGSYTAVVRGKNNTTGIGLVEAYNLQ